MTPVVLGVDGGNTKTVAVLATPDGAVIGAGRGGCSDIYGAPTPEAAVAEIAQAVEAAFPSGIAASEVSHAVFSLAGADWDEDKEFLRDRLAPLFPGADVLVVNDAIGALRAGTADGVGVAVVLGTGGCIGACGRDGSQWHSSWWGLNFGAYWIGLEALEVVYAAELGIGPPTPLTDAALAVFDEASVEDVLHGFHRREGGRSIWAAAQLAPDVLRLSDGGDKASRAIVLAHGVRLGQLAAVAAGKVGLEPPYPLVLLGGVFRGAGSQRIVDEIVRRLPGATPTRPSREPVAGALLIALDRAGAPYDPALVDLTLPSGELFDTRPGG